MATGSGYPTSMLLGLCEDGQLGCKVWVQGEFQDQKILLGEGMSSLCETQRYEISAGRDL